MFKVTARTILELGSELISSDIIAFYELIKNGFDAGSDRGVEISVNIVLSLRTLKEFRHKLTTRSTNFDKLKTAIKKNLSSDAETLYSQAVRLVDEANSEDGLLRALDEI